MAGWNGTGEERMEGTGQGGELAAFVIGDDLDDDDIFHCNPGTFFPLFLSSFPIFLRNSRFISHGSGIPPTAACRAGICGSWKPLH